jgi:AraC family transcriptional regulator of adaptative response/methylated-DNA-[protein]-cysteine methyltransferase
MDADAAWLAVETRSRTQDFVFAVKTTGIYCRPSCPARRPKRDNVLFFRSALEAERAGFRPCKRCRPRAPRSPSDALVARARAHLDRATAPVTLAALAEEVGASPFHLQRAFKRALGVSPRAYGEAARVARFRAAAKGAASVLDAAHAAGFGSSRAIHAAPLGITPGAQRRGGAGEHIAYAVVVTRHGRLLVAAGARGVVRVALGDRTRDLVASLREELPRATLARDASLSSLARRIVDDADDASIPLDLRGTALQLRVWDALRRIPRGQTRTYTEIAASIGAPRAARAVARACATNPAALVVPCHRVVRKDGDLAGYRWGLARKRRLLDDEAT